MRILAAALCALFVVYLPAHSQSFLPIYPKAELVTEVVLSDEDILNFVRQFMSQFGSSSAGATGEIGQYVRALDLETLAKAIQPVREIRSSQFHLPSEYEPRQILSFYSSEFTNGWSRKLWDVSQPRQGYSIFATQNMAETVLIAVMPGAVKLSVTSESKEAKTEAATQDIGGTLVVTHIIGTLDAQYFGQWMGNLVKKISEIDAKKKAAEIKPAAKPIVKPVVKPAAKPVKKAK